MFAYVRAGLSILAIFLVIVVIIHAKKNLKPFLDPETSSVNDT